MGPWLPAFPRHSGRFAPSAPQSRPGGPMTYPESHRDDVVETLHGHQIADPYRWLEDPDSPDTQDWVRRQNEFTQAELSGYPEREWFQATMSAILARPRAGVPVKKAGWYFVGRNDGTQAQDVVYVAE